MGEREGAPAEPRGAGAGAGAGAPAAFGGAGAGAGTPTALGGAGAGAGTPTALGGVRVLDLSTGVAGQFCGRLFADNGAEVLLVEPPGGAATRRAEPLLGSGDEARSCLFWHLNLGKRSVLADLADAAGRARVRALAEGADVVVLDEAMSVAALGLGVGGPAVVCDVTAFGRDGELRNWKGGELIHQALSGTMFENGQPGRTPLYGVGHRASYAAGTLAYAQSVAALLGHDGSRRTVDVSIAEVAASMSFNRATHYAYNGTIEGRDARTTPRAVVRCADGWAAIFIYDHRWRISCQALGLGDLVDDPRFGSEQDRLAHWDEFVAELERRLRDRPVDEVLAAGQREKVIVAKAVSPLELRDDPQLRFRRFWDRAEDGPLPRLGPMFGFSSTPQGDPGFAPELGGGPGAPGGPGASGGPGAPDEPGTSGEPPATWTRPRRAARPVPAARRPLAGLRLLDLTTAWSGPMATRILATLGAEVLKVEGPGRIDDWRGPVSGGLPVRYPDCDPGARPYNRCYQFNTQNHDKLGLALDLKHEAGIEIALRLADEADVLIANFSAGTLERMGLGWERLHARNPRLILVEMPAYGDGGPMGRYVALGPSMEFMGGMASLIGYGDGRPTTTGPAYLDPIGGFNAAAAILTALAAREHGGRGQRVELAQREAAMHWIGEEIVHALASGRDRAVAGNRLPHAAPHDAFPAAGEDEWVAIAAGSDAEFAALCRVLGLDDPLPGHDLATLPARKRHEDALSERISSRTRAREKRELAAELQRHGVPAAPVANACDVFESEFLMRRGLLQTVSHPEAGTHLQQGVPLHIEGWDLTIGTPAPCFGQDTETVLRERLGFDEDALGQLRADGVIADRPRGAEPAPAAAPGAAPPRSPVTARMTR